MLIKGIPPCVKCGKPILQDNNFCVNCGTPVSACSQCGRLLLPQNNFCGGCGAPVRTDKKEPEAVKEIENFWDENSDFWKMFSVAEETDDETKVAATEEELTTTHDVTEATLDMTKSTPTSDGARSCGTHCYFGAGDRAFEYQGWCYAVYRGNDKKTWNLVRFDEDNFNAIQILHQGKYTEKNHAVKLQINKFGVFVFSSTEIIQFDHNGSLLKSVTIKDVFPHLNTKIAETRLYDHQLYTVCVYNQSVYFTALSDEDKKGVIYKIDMASGYASFFEISRPQNLDCFEIQRLTGDDRYLCFTIFGDGNKMLDQLTGEVFPSEARHINFESKRCYYDYAIEPDFTPKGFTNHVMPSFGGHNARSLFYLNNWIFTGCQYIGFKYGHTGEFAHAENHYYNLYQLGKDGVRFLNAGSRGGIESLRIEGKYAYFDDEMGLRAKLDGSGMEKWKDKIELSYNNAEKDFIK